MTKEGLFINYIKQIEQSDSILLHSTFVIGYSAVQKLFPHGSNSEYLSILRTLNLTALSDQ